MSLLLVVDHTKEGNKAIFRLANLQIMTQLQNARQGPSAIAASSSWLVTPAAPQ